MQGFTYQKWGGEQRCRAGDWIVYNKDQRDTYTVSNASFEKTYEEVSPGVYRKTAPVWAEVAETDGVVKTHEGQTAYKRGDYVVSNNEDGSDAYAVSCDTFEAMYELD